VADVGEGRARSSNTWRQKAMDANTLALSTLVTWPALALRLALARQLEREVAHARGAGAGDLHRVARRVGSVPFTTAAAGVEQALGALAHQHQVDLRRTRVGQGHRQTRPGADRAHAGIQVQREADVELRDDLGAVGAAHVGRPMAPNRMASARRQASSVVAGSAVAGVR
jgi:hypothetical protein